MKNMKIRKIYLYAILSIIVSGCSIDETSQISVTDKFDPFFARELQRRGYIADARNITEGEVSGITELDLSGEYLYPGTLISLRGIEYFKSLQILDCSYNSILSLDMGKNTELTELYCIGNRIKSLNISNNPFLAKLDCSDNQIKTLDTNNNRQLIYYACSNNRLESLDISRNTALSYFECSGNRGLGYYFPVTAWFNNNSIPKNFQTGSWTYYGRTIIIDYWEAY